MANARSRSRPQPVAKECPKSKVRLQIRNSNMLTKQKKAARKTSRIDTWSIGAAGVHYAAYRFLRRGMLALPTVRNTPGTDLVVTSYDGRRHANIQVKTSQYSRAKFWIICSAKKFRKLPFGPNDFYLLLRPRRADDPGGTEPNEFEGFMLTAKEARQEMLAHYNYWKKKGKEPAFSLCIYVDKGRREKAWRLGERKNFWRKRWNTWRIGDQ